MKSNVSDYLKLALCILKDAYAKCSADVSDLRDFETIKSRVKKEGMSFLTITLPTFGKDFDLCLAKGCIDSTDFRAFRKSGSTPAFLQGMISLVFDRETGRLYDNTRDNLNALAPAIDGVRQVSFAFKKLELECDPKRVARTLSEFVEVEHSLSSFEPSKEAVARFDNISRVLWDHILANVRLDMLLPRHGPGATAERIRGNRKYVWRRWHERLEAYFPLFGSAYTLSAACETEAGLELVAFDPVEERVTDIVSFIPAELEQPVRVVTVPKTMKGPRIIAIEPVCMQYAQQAIRSALYKELESRVITSGHVNFTDQSINQRLALIASKDGSYATIDLSEASDRVPRSLALCMFNGNPDLRDAIDACRSTRAILPNGQIVGPLLKFASMGSALCFPVEAMYFYTLCVMAALEYHNLPDTWANAYNVSRGIYVYGDDIIVPIEQADITLDYLQRYNCKVNTNKTYKTGKFRESCGTDAFDGEVVTPTYVTQVVPKSKRQHSELISWVATANSFYQKGYWRTSSYMHSICERYLGNLPYVSPDSPGLGRVSYLGYKTVHRWNSKLHRWEVKAWVASPVYRTDELDGYAALYKSLSKLEDLKDLSEPRDPLHLHRTARYGSVTLKSRWVPVTG